MHIYKIHPVNEPIQLFPEQWMEDYLRCSVCKDVLKEPVSIPCGHSFCKTCIQSYWDEPEQEECPECGYRFETRPALNLNLALDHVLKQAGFSPALPAQSYAGPEDMACDICTGKRKRAVKWCLTCSVAYCETHVRQHYTVEALQRHTLTEVTEDLETRICMLHHRALEVFCRTDQVLICLVCVMEGHKDHESVLGGKECQAEINTKEPKKTSRIQQRAQKWLGEVLKINKRKQGSPPGFPTESRTDREKSLSEYGDF